MRIRSTLFRPPLRLAPRALAHAVALALGWAAASGAVAATGTPPTGGIVVVQNCDDDGTGSLREAVRDLAVSGDTIDLRFLSCSTITLTSGAIATGLDDLDIVGPGSPLFAAYAQSAGRTLSISGGGAFPVFAHLGTGTLRLSGVGLTEGYKYSATDRAPGGCIYSQGSVVLERATVSDCTARSAGSDAAEGGGLFVAGDLVLVDSVISGSTAIADQSVAFGGGASVGGALRSKYSVFAGNEASGSDGGGRGSFGAAVVRGDAFVAGSSIVLNTADDVGGLALLGSGATTPLVVRNTTIFLNQSGRLSATAGLLAGAELALSNSTIAGNFLAVDPAPIPGAAAGLSLAGQARIDSSIVSRNAVTPAAQAPVLSDLGGTQSTVVGSHNLIGTSSVPLPPDTLRGDPRLVPMLSPVRTHHGLAFLLPFADADSPAIDAGANPFALAADQRGAPYRRLEGAAPDIGAYEADPDRIFQDGFD